jgi:hypothetical protein
VREFVAAIEDIMANADVIRDLNDQFRQTLQGGRIVITQGVAVRDDTATILDHVRSFRSFSEDNDPYGEHDFGAFDCAGQKIFWKIDYYDSDLDAGSPDPADPAVTTRVLTIMLADEY